jgi:26S proteasome regulatory subunit N9
MIHCFCLVAYMWFYYCDVQVKSLMGTNVEWLYFILQAFNAGDLAKYKELCSKYQAELTAQPALIENEKKLWEKINILCLMELIFR